MYELTPVVRTPVEILRFAQDDTKNASDPPVISERKLL
jgi:hypothetical protein